MEILKLLNMKLDVKWFLRRTYKSRNLLGFEIVLKKTT